MKKFLHKYIYLLLLAAWMVTLAVIIDNYWSANASLKTVKAKLSYGIHKSEKSFEAIFRDTSLCSKLLSGQLNGNQIKPLLNLDYFLFIYHQDSLSDYKLDFWNTQQVEPFSSLLYMQGRSGMIQLGNGYYVWNRKDTNQYKALALIPVKWEYFITNEYIRNRFADKDISMGYDISREEGSGEPVYSIYGNELFRVSDSGMVMTEKNNPVSAILLLGAFFILFFLIHIGASMLSTEKGAGYGFSLLILLAGGLRLISYYFDFPINLRQFELFDPAIYGSNRFLGSLGDVLINSLLFVWFVFFLRYQVQEQSYRLKPLKGNWKLLYLVLAASIILILTLGGSFLTKSLIADSNISFDVINFFSLSIYSVAGFGILCSFAMGYYLLCQVILFLLKPFYPGRMFVFLVTTAVLGLIFLSFRIGYSENNFYLAVIVWLLVFLFLLNNAFFSLLASRLVSSKFVFWLFFFSLSITAVILRENRKKEEISRKHYAELLAAKADPSNESLLNSLLTDFNPGFLSLQFERFRDSAQGRILKDSLLQQAAGYLMEKYDLRIHVFSSEGNNLFNDDSVILNDLNTILQTQARKTGRSGLYYFDESYDKYSYISRVDVLDTDSIPQGFVFVMASPKRFKTEALYPELFSRGRTTSIESSPLYAIGIYKDWQLVNRYNDYPFPAKLKPTSTLLREFELITTSTHTELRHYAGSGRMVIIAREKRVSLESITLFSYLFGSFLILTALFWLFNSLVRYLLQMNRIKGLWKINIRNQIHGTVLFVSILSFTVIGIATILFFNKRYDNNNREMLNRTIHIMERDVNRIIRNTSGDADSIQFDGAVKEKLASLLNELSEIHGTDLNLFDLTGKLQASSLPLPYTRGIISTLMHPMAFYHLHNLDEVQFYQKENIGALKYSSMYIPMVDAKGHKYAYLQIPYYTAQNRQNQEISGFLVTLINLNAFIFLLAGIVALFITNRITRSFSLIVSQMKKVSISTHNEPIIWKRDDEVGALVNEYNKMVNKLEESAQALAKSEREGAWREMARQIAHEIKNPLTPMKLSLQYLEKSIRNNDPNINKLAADVSNTLIEQIDHLNHIANEFSQFANIEQAKPEDFDINEALRNVLNLFRSGDLFTQRPEWLSRSLIVTADKSHINRVFTNLLQNALQAVPASRTPHIQVEEELSDGKVIIRVVDNGDGIDEAVQPFIFTPNFTTKMSGTGLGLAMCKRMIEQAGGSISFTTIPGKGTTFSVELPMKG